MSFDVQKVTKDVIEWTRDWFSVNGPGCNAVIGISGGKDSTVTAAVCVQALGADRVIGVLLPNGEQHDIDVAALTSSTSSPPTTRSTAPWRRPWALCPISPASTCPRASA